MKAPASTPSMTSEAAASPPWRCRRPPPARRSRGANRRRRRRIASRQYRGGRQAAFEAAKRDWHLASTAGTQRRMLRVNRDGLHRARPHQGLPHGRGRGARAARRRPRPRARASSSCCSARRAAASRRCSTSSAASTCRPAARVRYRDHDLTTADEAALTRYRREHVGFVFQFYNLIPSLTARENVALVTEIAAHPMPARGGAGAGRPGRAARPLPGAALRRRAAARRHRPRHRQAARRAAVRRADRRARLSRPASWCSRRSSASTASSARRRRSSPTTPPSPAWPTAWCACADGRDRRRCDAQRAQAPAEEI